MNITSVKNQQQSFGSVSSALRNAGQVVKNQTKHVITQGTTLTVARLVSPSYSPGMLLLQKFFIDLGETIGCLGFEFRFPTISHEAFNSFSYICDGAKALKKVRSHIKLPKTNV